MQPGQDVPLAAHTMFRSIDLDEARERVARVFCDHRLETIGRSRLDARHNHFAGERLSLNYIEYGGKTMIAPGELGNFYLLQIPLEGGAAIANGACRYYSHPGVAAILNPHLATTMIWEEGCRQVLVWVDRQAMQEHLAAQLGAAPGRPLTFTGGIDLTTGEGARLRQLVLHLVREVDRGSPPIGNGSLMARQIEAAVMAGLLDAQAHNYRGVAGNVAARLAPRQIRQAEEFMLAHLDRPIDLGDVARSSGVSTRALQKGFRDFRDTTPMNFLRDARLDHAHRDLQSASPGLTVTDVALRWGFGHFGRFSQIYRARYGCSPSKTLSAAKAVGFAE